MPPAAPQRIRLLLRLPCRKRVIPLLCGFSIGLLAPIFITTIKSDNHGPKLMSVNHPHEVMVGVMTTAANFASRGSLIRNTWVQHIFGQVIFFSSESTPHESDDDDLVALEGVDDSYPPQLKSFQMLAYMWDRYGERFQWFMRVDDDAYVDGENLRRLLAGIDSRQALLIGQAGEGRSWERSKLYLDDKWSYCMGGSGMIFSRETLRRIRPHIGTCLRTLFTSHEDTEISRCVFRFASTSCTSSPDTRKYFVNSYEMNSSFSGPLQFDLISQAITLHRVRTREALLNVYRHFLAWRLRELSTDFLSVKKIASLLKGRQSVEQQDVGVEQAFDFFAPGEQRFSLHSASQIRSTTSTHEKQFEENLMREINMLHQRNARLQGSLHDLQSFTYAGRMRRTVRTHEGAFVENLIESWTHADSDTPFHNLHRFLQYFEEATVEQVFVTTESRSTMCMIVPLFGKTAALQRFVSNFVTVSGSVKNHGIEMSLIVMLHNGAQSNFRENSRLLSKYAVFNVNFFPLAEHFNRGRSLNKGSKHCTNDSILLFMDVDMLFTQEFIFDSVLYTTGIKAAYFPIVFSQYDTELLCSVNKTHCDLYGLNNVHQWNGYWRTYGFGMLAISHQDFISAGGFNHEIDGWGKEDVDLFHRVLTKTAVIRSPAPSLIHLYHTVKCDQELQLDQLNMCKSSLLNNIGDNFILARNLSLM